MPQTGGAAAVTHAHRHRARVAAAAALVSVAIASALAAGQTATTDATQPQAVALSADLNRIFDAPALSRALVAVRIQSLRDARVVFERNAGSRVIPGSVMKLVTAAVAAERLGWDRRFETRLEAVGRVENGALRGDLVVVGNGDPSIGAGGGPGAALFDEWADALRAAGITRVEGRIIGDDNAFDDEPLGAGWAWDYLSAGYAAPSGALSYNENVVVLRVRPGAAPGGAASVEAAPLGHGLTFDVGVTTATAGSPTSLTVGRAPGSATVTVRGQVAAGSAPLVRTTTVDNPTTFFVEGLRTTLASRGISVSHGAWDIDDAAPLPAGEARRLIARRESAPLSSLVGYTLKASQNYYGEMLLKALGRGDATRPGSSERGREAVRQTLAAWKIPGDALVMYDGSGLSRYNYLSAELLVAVLERVWRDERLRGPFLAALPVGGHDGTLEARMRTPALDRRVQAKTGTINNVRSLAGYVEAASGEKFAFAMIANHYTAPNAEIDAVMEAALERVVDQRR